MIVALRFNVQLVTEQAKTSEGATTKERTMSDEERIIYNTAEDQEWADLLSPARRKIIIGAGLTAAGLTAGDVLAAGQEVVTPGGEGFKANVAPPDPRKRPWGYETYKEAAPQPPRPRPRRG